MIISIFAVAVMREPLSLRQILAILGGFCRWCLLPLIRAPPI